MWLLWIMKKNRNFIKQLYESESVLFETECPGAPFY